LLEFMRPLAPEVLDSLDEQISALRFEVDRLVHAPPAGFVRVMRQLEEKAVSLKRAVQAWLEEELPAWVEAKLRVFLHQAEAIEVRISEG
jgi:hypothetical protein